MLEYENIGFDDYCKASGILGKPITFSVELNETRFSKID